MSTFIKTINGKKTARCEYCKLLYTCDFKMCNQYEMYIAKTMKKAELRKKAIAECQAKYGNTKPI